MSAYGASPSTAARRHAPQSHVSDWMQHPSSHTPSHASFKGPPAAVSGLKVESFVAPAPPAAPFHYSSSRSRPFAAPPLHVPSATYRHTSSRRSIAPTVLPSDSASQLGGRVVGSAKTPSIVPVDTPSIHHSSSNITRSLSHSLSASPALVPAPIPSHVSRHVPSVASSSCTSSSHTRALSVPNSANSLTSSRYSVIHAKPNQMVIVPLADGGCVIVPPKGKRVRVSQVYGR
ncbi:uncharacterized protein BT62DRAFT_1014087 [Guyanagaster necrorhizus]|uniref:Uncharacterized protein n=1 Tax=Guyanagaster necrorhizus TaxID=856835 RepID=A0A9P7VEZ5_9AGAR|nr:uncharacterized protein BT62DRAFT_1014087 [Guyanagaster necrorhizus MCA 3950]KAG7439347.1 hypothetical protein BT62DRAFT_1014087 [Guyanagaster necrorhizus MCA 3950]